MTAAATDLTIFSEEGYSATLKIADALVKSGMLPRGIDNPFKAFAIIQKGREIGVGPMRALTGIALIEGKPTVSPELKLEQFKGRGGHVKWIKSDNTVAHLHLKAPNGDEHEEIVTLDDMKVAGVAGKDNWRKYPKSMLRARCVGFGLRALGEGDGSYTPDELGAEVDESGEAVGTTYAPPTPRAPPPAPRTLKIELEPPPVTPPPPKPVGSLARVKGAPRGPKGEHMPGVANTDPSAPGVVVSQVGVVTELETKLEASVMIDVDHVDKKTGEVTTKRYPKVTKAQLAKIHILKDQCRFEDEDWRGRLEAKYGKRSSGDLAEFQASDLIDRLQKMVDRAREVANDLRQDIPHDEPEDVGDVPQEWEMRGDPRPDPEERE